MLTSIYRIFGEGFFRQVSQNQVESTVCKCLFIFIINQWYTLMSQLEPSIDQAAVNSSAEILTPDLSTRTGSQAQDQPSGARLPTPKWSHNLAVSNVYQGSWKYLDWTVYVAINSSYKTFHLVTLILMHVIQVIKGFSSRIWEAQGAEELRFVVGWDIK